MYSAKKMIWAAFLLAPLLIFSTGNIFANFADDSYDDTAPEVNAKVARISFLRGEVQIRRLGSDDWERVAQNLPIVEGDEIATDSNSRIEIQFDTYRFLRLDENSYLKITALRDEGISVSIPQGTMSLRILEFDKDRSYFEIDAPRTTIAVQKAGMYRIDSGNKDDSEIRVTVTNNGQARVYSENSGFTLRDGRSAKVYISGSYAGEWDIDDASRFGNEFDSWALDRDTTIANKIRKSSYDKNYDRDIYGAEDLDENGEWIYTRDYGNVWRPYRNATSSYANWSPYRYGNWRWIPPYGWTWVNDEPWGWATYHHGRWISHGGYWVWSPYGHHGSRRSWWRPALVVISWVGDSICWYPLPYGYGYYNYNRRYNIINNNTTIINNNTTIINNNGNTRRIDPVKYPREIVPGGGVVTVDASEFGRGQKAFRTANPTLANEVLSKKVDENQSPPLLPTFKDLNGKVSREILIENPKFDQKEIQVKTGASERINGKSLDETLLEQKVFQNRSPNPRIIVDADTMENPRSSRETRGTGAVIRPQTPVKTQDDSGSGNSETKETQRNRTGFPTRSTGGSSTETKDSTPTRAPREDRETNQSPPFSPPIRTPEPKREPQPERKPDPPRERQEPRQQPRIVPQQPRSEPRKEEQKPSAPPSETKIKPNDSKEDS